MRGFKMIKFSTKKIEHVGCLLNVCEYFDKYYKRNVLNDIKNAKINCDDKVLCIGTGPMPCTAVNIALMSGCRVTALDNDPAAVEAAKKLLVSRGYDSIVDVVLGDGKDFDISNFSVIHIALQVAPRQEIIKNIYRKASPETRIIVRNPGKILALYYGKSKIPKLTKSDEVKYTLSSIIIKKGEVKDAKITDSKIRIGYSNNYSNMADCKI